jgi:seryl-tRNA synthetase
VPEPLRKYLPGAPEFIPFSRELPKDSTSQKVKCKVVKAQKSVSPPTSGDAAEAADKLKDMKT